MHQKSVADLPCVAGDIRDAHSVSVAFEASRPSLVIHAAYDRDEASIVEGTENVAKAARSVGANLMYVSSDAVFRGDGGRSDEAAAPDPVWDYGRWKAQAEAIVLASSGATIVRLPLIVSLTPEDHVVTQIRACITRGEPTVWFTDEARQPARAVDIAYAMWQIASLTPADRSGHWHLPGPESLTRYEIAQRIVARLGLDPTSVVGAPTPATAQRPRHITMGDSRARTHVGWSPSPILT